MQTFRYIRSAWSTDGVRLRLWQVEAEAVHCTLCQAPLPPGSLCTRLRPVRTGTGQLPYCTDCVSVDTDRHAR